MKIYTKTGDKGTTSLFPTGRVSKNDIRIDAVGTLDELNANIDVLRAHLENDDCDNVLEHIQNVIITISADIVAIQSDLKFATIEKIEVAFLEKEIDKLQAGLQPGFGFIVHHTCRAGAFANLARTVCRRAERAIVSVIDNEPHKSIVLTWVNRLSDYLFTLGRRL